MSVAEIGLLHGRYVRLSDRFKSLWTYHQFASGVFKNLIPLPLPYRIEFQSLYDRIKSASAILNSSQVNEAAGAVGLCELSLDRTSTQLLRADEQVSASIVRRFFEKLKRQDENVVCFLIKFYFYADALEGDCRDKLDYLFTRIGEDFVADRNEYVSRDSLEFRERIISLVSLLRPIDAPQEEVVRLIRAIRGIRDDIQAAAAFEELTERNLLKNARLFKHRLGHLYFHPDVLMAIVELNVATKNKFLQLYSDEEQRIVGDSQKLVDHGPAIERNFGYTNPELREEIARFREFKQRFDESRASSNMKHDVVTHLKQSISNILAQLDRGLGGDDMEISADLPPSFFDEAEQMENIATRFPRDPQLHPYLARIGSVIDNADREAMPEEIANFPNAAELRLEAWEIAAYQKLFDRREAEAGEDNEDLWLLYLRAAALRIKVDEEATLLAASNAAGVSPEPELLAKAKDSLDSGKELDEQFNDFLHEAVYYSNPRILHQLYRSRFRLLRGFSGLWLIYDRGGQPAGV
ncbi:MAG TPA: hypothetical protein VL284_12865 [Thermoanaerobaculia bacterium]|nr:hypothetical protein [Thermoanaerobaculia bacterium]